jgi:hypothetical protein
MDLSNFTPLVDGEAKQSYVQIAQEAAISRLCPIQDAYDFWGIDRSGPGTGSGGYAPVYSGTGLEGGALHEDLQWHHDD